MQSTQTTVQALLSVLVGRDPNETIMIEDNQLRIVSTINLLSNEPQSLGQMFQAAKAMDEKLAERNNPTSNESVLQDLVNQPQKTETRGRPRKPEGAPKSPYVSKDAKVPMDNWRRAWSQADLKIASDLKDRGADFEDIGKVLGRTACAVKCQLKYLVTPKVRKPKGSVRNSVTLM